MCGIIISRIAMIVHDPPERKRALGYCRIKKGEGAGYAQRLFAYVDGMRVKLFYPNSSAVLTILAATLTPKGQRLSQPWQPMHSSAWCVRDR